ncbi:MAG: ABC transporter permease [Cyclobacteriaceae bacterium]
MLYSFIITTLRSFKKNKFNVLANIFGLSIGITCCLVIYALLKHELTFDSFHKNSDNIYRVYREYRGDFETSYSAILPNPTPWALTQQKNYIKEVIPMRGPNTASVEFNLDGQHKIFIQEGIVFTTSAFLNNLEFPILQGSDPSALDVPYKCFITEEVAQKYFGDRNPIGEFITYDEDKDFEVVGILANTPTNTNVPFEMLVSFETILKINPEFMKYWGSTSNATAYVVLEPGDDITKVEDEINHIVKPNFGEDGKEKSTFGIQPLAEVHTDTKYGDGVNYAAPTEVLVGFVLLAFITLFASILNFINLATAQAVQRSKEIGIRKTLGSSKANLIWQFLGETYMIVIVSILIAFTIGQVFIQEFNAFLSMISFEIGYDFTTVIFAILLSVVVTGLAGIYPALILGGYNPIDALNNQVSLHRGSGNGFLRKGLVIAQFVVANLLIIITIIVSSQMTFVKTADLGFDRENIIQVDLPDRLNDKAHLIKAEFEKLSFVVGATQCIGAPQANSNWSTNYKINNIEQNDEMHTLVKFADEDYLDVFKIPLLRGRYFNNSYTSDTTMKLVVSEEFLQRTGIHIDSAIGANVEFMGDWKGNIIGVVKDYHVWGLQEAIQPSMMLYRPENMGQIDLKVASNQFDKYLPEIEKVFRSFGPNEYFQSSILSHSIEENYIVENLIYNTFRIFAVLAILIGIFGMYGLVSFMATKNNKSISIRKVFGASISSIMIIFSREFIILTVVAFCIAAPVGFWVCQEFLNGFKYRIDITFGFFVISIVISLIITIFTVGYKTFQTAIKNPVDTLRYE